jgi:hypothetical protein
MDEYVLENKLSANEHNNNNNNNNNNKYSGKD